MLDALQAAVGQPLVAAGDAVAVVAFDQPAARVEGLGDGLAGNAVAVDSTIRIGERCGDGCRREEQYRAANEREQPTAYRCD